MYIVNSKNDREYFTVYIPYAGFLIGNKKQQFATFSCQVMQYMYIGTLPYIHPINMATIITATCC